MSTIYYPSASACTGGELPQYSCQPCIDPELGRIRSVFLYRSTVSFVNPSSPAEWGVYINNGDVHIIKDTQGNYDGGTTTELVGFGDLETVNAGILHTLLWRDPNLDQNCDFYNALLTQTEWQIGWRTETYVWFSDTVATFTPKVPVPDDIKGYVTYETTAKWSSNSIPCPYETPAGIFDRCFAVSS